MINELCTYCSEQATTLNKEDECYYPVCQGCLDSPCCPSDCVHEEMVAMMSWDIEDSYKRAKHAMTEARDATELLIQFGRMQVMQEMMNNYVQRTGV